MTKALFPKQQIRWHRRMEARVAAGVILLVALSLAGVVLATVRVTTRSSLQRAAVNLQDARSAFYRLVGDRAEFAASQTRLIIALPLFRSSMINPVIAGDRSRLTTETGWTPRIPIEQTLADLLDYWRHATPAS